MASSEQQLRLSLAEEATCPICLGYFAEPVSVHCGHTFCTPCITRYWQRVQGPPYPCPQCRETAPISTLRPNRQAASMVQILAQGAPVAPPSEGHPRCTKHDKKLKLFCQEDQTPICVNCLVSSDHQDHKVRSVREAAQEYKDQFQSYLDNMKMKLENIISLQRGQETKVTDLEEDFKSQRERIIGVFNKVQRLLEKEKSHHLNSLQEKEKKTLQRIREKVSELDKQLAWVRSLIAEMESKCQQPDVELLKDAKSMLSRYETLKGPAPHSDPSNDQEEQTEKGCVLEETTKEDLERKIIASLEWRWARSFAGAVTLNPDTAHRWLVLSEDGRSVRHGDRAQDLPDTPERFSPVVGVLGRERLSSDRHYWEVEVGNSEWDLGVCDESVSRKGKITLSPEDGFWTVCLRNGKYQTCTSLWTCLTPSVPPRVVGLFLDYEACRLSVYNVTDRSLLFTFSGDSFPRTLRPFFSPELSNRGMNSGPLRVLPVTEQ